jgi:hypothetical protein
LFRKAGCIRKKKSPGKQAVTEYKVEFKWLCSEPKKVSNAVCQTIKHVTIDSTQQFENVVEISKFQMPIIATCNNPRQKKKSLQALP